MAIRRCFSLQAEQERTIEPQLTKEGENNNQAKETCCIEFYRPSLLSQGNVTYWSAIDQWPCGLMTRMTVIRGSGQKSIGPTYKAVHK